MKKGLITAQQARTARQQLGMTQNELISESGISAYKLKQFEAGKYSPDIPFLESLKAFIVSKGLELPDDDAHPAPTPAPAKPGSSMVRQVSRPCFYIADSVAPDLIDQCLERMHYNDRRIADLMTKPLQSAFLSGYSDETIKANQDLFSAMAENYLVFRLLQGDPIIQAPGEGDPKTLSDLVGQFFAQSPVISGDKPADQTDEPAETDEEETDDEVTQ